MAPAPPFGQPSTRKPTEYGRNPSATPLLAPCECFRSSASVRCFQPAERYNMKSGPMQSRICLYLRNGSWPPRHPDTPNSSSGRAEEAMVQAAKHAARLPMHTSINSPIGMLSHHLHLRLRGSLHTLQHIAACKTKEDIHGFRCWPREGRYGMCDERRRRGCLKPASHRWFCRRRVWFQQPRMATRPPSLGR